jgi:two-component system chemotaxis sensor kinase CheA
VTDISGRGVGMDVVKRAVEEAGGSINVNSVPGKGSTFSITLPKGVTTQIITGYLARVRERTYVLPLDRVRETFKVGPGEVERLTDRGRFIRRHDEILPVQVLAESLGLEALAWPAKGQPVVTVMARRRKLAVAVDGVIGVQKVVIRPLKGLAAGCELFSGGALLGDGTVALVLDLDRLVEAQAAP